MNTRRNIEKLIQKSEHELFALHEEMMKKGAYIQGLRDTLKYLPREGSAETPPKLRPGTDLAKAYEAIRTAGKPLHIVDLVKTLGKEPTHKNRVSLAGSIGFYVRRKQFFNRPAPNTYGIMETEEPDLSNGEPPDDFGIEEEKAESESRPF